MGIFLRFIPCPVFAEGFLQPLDLCHLGLAGFASSGQFPRGRLCLTPFMGSRRYPRVGNPVRNGEWIALPCSHSTASCWVMRTAQSRAPFCPAARSGASWSLQGTPQTRSQVRANSPRAGEALLLWEGTSFWAGSRIASEAADGALLWIFGQ